jgi:protocatechuate 3,4-dioxygenase beta subunit
MLIAVGLLVGIVLVYISRPQDEMPIDTGGDPGAAPVPGGDEVKFTPEKHDPWGDARRIRHDTDFATFDRTNTGCVRGHVYDLNGRPISTAEVTKDGPGDWRTAMADKNGFYELRLPAGRVNRIKAVMTGYSANGAIINNLRVDEVREGVDIYLGDGADAVGHVVNRETGQGVPGVMIRLYTSDRAANAYNRSAQETSDDSGDIRFYSLGLHKYIITVRHMEYFLADQGRVEVVIEPDKINEFTIELNMGGIITGTVTDESGQPVPEARVWVAAAPNAPFPGPYRTATVGQDGKYRLTGLKTGDFKVICHKPGYRRNDDDGNVVSVVAGETAPDMDFRLKIGNYIAGTVTSKADGMPIEGAIVTVYGNGSYGSGKSDSEGHYRITGLKDGAFTVSANLHMKDYLTERQSSEAGRDDCHFVLSKGGVVKGRVYVPGEFTGFSVRMEEVEAEEGKQPNIRQQYFRNKDGSFELKKMKAGAYTIKAFGRNYSDSEVQTVTVASEQVTEVVLEMGPPSANPKLVLQRARITPYRRDTGSKKLPELPGRR